MIIIIIIMIIDYSLVILITISHYSPD